MSEVKANGATDEFCTSAWKRPRGLAVAFLLLAVIAGSIALAAWALRAKGKAQAAAQQAAEERDQTQSAEKQAEQQRDEAETAQRAAVAERDRAMAAEKAAKRTAENTLAVLAFFQDKVFSTGLSGGLGKDATLRQALGAAEPQVAEASVGRPLVEASIRDTLGRAYFYLGELDPAIKQYKRALALRKTLLGPDHPDTVACRNDLARAYRVAGRSAEASRLFDQ